MKIERFRLKICACRGKSVILQPQNVLINKIIIMILHFEHLGAIKQMSIDLSKPMILMCGPNGTGKTYASYVLYAFLSSNYGASILDVNNVKIPLVQSISAFVNDSSKESGVAHFEITKQDIQIWISNFCECIKSNIGDVFGVGDDLCKKLFSKFTISCDFTDADFENTLNSSLSLKLGMGDKVLMTISKKKCSNIIEVETSLSNKDNALFQLNMISILNRAMRILTFGDNRTARMLTVERNSIYTFKTELSLSRNELIDRIQQGASKVDFMDMLSDTSRRYPLAIKESLRIANDLETVQKQTSYFSQIALEIERDLLNGDVSMTKAGDVEFHASSMPKTRKLPFHLSSSIVKTMASFVVYLRHLARKGDTLIIDEPEMNFHPDVQVVLARIFAKLANNGLKVVISTHSDYIIREINNMIMVGTLWDKNVSGDDLQGYSSDYMIHASELCVLFLHAMSKGVVSKELPISEFGFEVSTIDETIMEQSSRSERLYELILDKRER